MSGTAFSPSGPINFGGDGYGVGAPCTAEHVPDATEFGNAHGAARDSGTDGKVVSVPEPDDLLTERAWDRFEIRTSPLFRIRVDPCWTC